MALKIVRRYDANGRELTEKDLETFRLDSPVVREILANLNREVSMADKKLKKMYLEDFMEGCRIMCFRICRVFAIWRKKV